VHMQMNKFGVGHKRSLAPPLRSAQAEDIGQQFTTQKPARGACLSAQNIPTFPHPPDLFQARA
jgi:hypothetical protein